jgi:2,4-dienoyl-CoA reductase-like NADH-dependent reductase (Old Yellow Enzyme family)
MRPGLRFRQRIVKTPQDMNLADLEDGTITRNSIDFYGSLAAGGVRGIIVEQSIVDREGWREGTIGAFDDGCIPGLSRLAQAVHEHGCPIILQINPTAILQAHLAFQSDGRWFESITAH